MTLNLHDATPAAAQAANDAWHRIQAMQPDIRPPLVRQYPTDDIALIWTGNGCDARINVSATGRLSVNYDGPASGGGRVTFHRARDVGALAGLLAVFVERVHG